jgi:hypothetical protein
LEERWRRDGYGSYSYSCSYSHSLIVRPTLSYNEGENEEEWE